MAVYHLAFTGTDPIRGIIKGLRTNIVEYGLHELTSGRSGDTPNITGAHPLAMEAGAAIAAGGTDFTSPLPSIGVESLDDAEGAGRDKFLGGGASTGELTEVCVDALLAQTASQRKEDGVIATTTTLTALKALLVANGGPIFVSLQKHLFERTINVSLWTDDWEVTDCIYDVIKALLLREELRGILKRATVRGQRGLYNFEFGRMLFGGEFTISGLQGIQLWKIDSSVGDISDVEETWPVNERETDGLSDDKGPEFVGIGRST